MQAKHQQVDWELVSHLTLHPRGVPVPITAPTTDVEQLLAAAPRVQNVLPAGSTWDGKSDLPMDEAAFRQVVSEIEPGSTPVAPAAASPASSASGSATPQRGAQKNGG